VRVLLIALPNPESIWMPLNLLMLAGMLEKHGVDCTLVDWGISGRDAVEREIKKQYDIVGLSVLSTTRWDAFDTASLIRKLSPKSQIVMGGVHATIMKEQTLKHCDVVIKGDGEGPFLDLAQGKDPVERIIPLDDLPFAGWSKIDLWKYPGKGHTKHDRRRANGVDIFHLPRVSLQTSRSCRSHCRFCSSFWVQGPYRQRSPVKVVDEMEMLYAQGMKSFFFVDDSFYLDKSKALEFCAEILRRGLKVAYRVQTRSDVLDKEYTEALGESGCYNVAIGVESGADAILNIMHKSSDTLTTLESIENCKKAGIRVQALMIVGNEGETDETIQQTKRFLRKAKPSILGASWDGLMLFPGTSIYQKAVKEGLIDDSFWDTREKIRSYKYPKEQIMKWASDISRYSFRSWVAHRIKLIESRLRRG
jgi:anaerobic magnesium-protoporphyrin IX monomethyl ester cyclase